MWNDDVVLEVQGIFFRAVLLYLLLVQRFRVAVWLKFYIRLLGELIVQNCHREAGCGC
ncbi:hypothetical protein O998_01930 [Anaplasma phagocytophilum str. Norway variant1]|uniref:Uncharacterized protein n=1 Tax=Anaplasma phagocytophilum str. Norway variant1 TaxID=1392506 RepID=A0A7H9DZL1_ANAPH|nr:hypothetical protein [Anaplasma phagocytophilum]QLL66611.1 hypothetical protein O998_01930 [Anaplasma phagocytophilum str. Norway variant1]